MIELIDQVQYDLGRGPCLKAFRTGRVLRIDDTDDEKRWPEFARAPSAHGIRRTPSLPLMADGEGIGALDLYSRTVRAFSPADEVHARCLVDRVGRRHATLQAPSPPLARPPSTPSS